MTLRGLEPEAKRGSKGERRGVGRESPLWKEGKLEKL